MTIKAEEISAQQDAWKDFETHRVAEQKRLSFQRPRKVGNVLAQLVSLRGYAQIRISAEQEVAWQAVVGPELSSITQFSKLRGGTMNVTVANSLLMQELIFRKEELLTRLQAELPAAGIRHLRFKVGKIISPQSETKKMDGST
ncbi:DUF721 domain-containing protein [Bythopirellula polymerisocia]|uniref:DUF721 domain-containing protein n=1 Tax=Bythopirellula polymerisocia TaxID=2528003 RepID=A0A5C6D3U3_9BACT|nr:DUF721 domain-containing protein [Bythopirellula polymerisocia]TWU29916.1 hypothetical protein Pla144_06970 [Bythopirellula polymerisocia]